MSMNPRILNLGTR